MSWVHNHIVLPLAQPERHRGLARRLRALQRFDALPRNKQQSVQEQRVRAILDHAAESCPWYRDAFRATGFRTADWKLGQPIGLPAVTRDILRSCGGQMCSERFERSQLSIAATGGTTSAPARIWRDREGLRDKTALQFYLNRLAGFDQGAPVMLIWGAEHDLAQRPSWRWRFYEETLLRRRTVHAGALTPQFYETSLAALNRLRPEVLYGYSGSTTRFAEWLRTTNAHFHRPRRIIVTAEPLILADRSTLEEVFQCQVTEHYGSRELGMIAAQCQAGRYHFHPWACYVELIPAGDCAFGSMYQLIVTDLLNRGMPLIRYETGDCVLVVDSPCLCGSWYPSVTTILGRSCENLTRADGSIMPGLILNLIGPGEGKGFSAVRQVQLIQKTVRRMHLRFVAEGEPRRIEQELRTLTKEIDHQVGDAFQWTFEPVAEIPRERSGKLRLVISEVTELSRETPAGLEPSAMESAA
jgi:phenylacetate-CoA ligase